VDSPRYDKLTWYDDPDVLAAKRKQLEALAKWLVAHDLVEDSCRFYYTPPLASDFALDGGDLTPKGQKILKKHFKQWVKDLNTDLTMLDKALKESSNG
jgi:hypothetical protein